MSQTQGVSHRETLRAALETYYIMTHDCITEYVGHKGHEEEVRQMNRELIHLRDLMTLHGFEVPQNL